MHTVHLKSSSLGPGNQERLPWEGDWSSSEYILIYVVQGLKVGIDTNIMLSNFVNN